MTNEVFDMTQQEQLIRDGVPHTIFVGNKTYKVKQIGNTVARRISDLEKEALLLEREAKQELTLKRAKKIDNKIRTVQSKTAAYYILGNYALFVPFLFAIYWRIIDLRNSEHAFRINSAGFNNEGLRFFFQGFQLIKAALVLSTNLLTKGIEDYQQREESATNMLEEDALPKKAEDDKSAASLKARRTTKR